MGKPGQLTKEEIREKRKYSRAYWEYRRLGGKKSYDNWAKDMWPNHERTWR